MIIFDYIGGTSTGAIIASGLSRGMLVTELLDFYEQKGESMFDKTFLLKRVKHFYNEGPLLKGSWYYDVTEKYFG